MPRKVLIDCDPGIDDAVALCMALFDPRLEVVGITAVAGNVDAHQATANVLTLLDQLDPPKLPRVGAALVSDRVPPADARHIHGEDGLGDIGLVGAELHNQRSADKVIADALNESPGEVSILALGPLTNISRVLRCDPTLASKVDRIIMVGGSISGVGNITAAAEFNIYCDPESAKGVFHSATTKTLIPLDATHQLVMEFDFVDALPSATTRAGALLRKIVPQLFRSYRQHLGREGIHLHDVFAVLYALHPELFETEDMAGDVEATGGIARGATIFDRRPRPQWRKNMEVVTDVDAATVKDCIIRGLRYAGQNSPLG